MSSPADFAPNVLRGLPDLVPAHGPNSQLALRFALSAWIRQAGLELPEALRVLAVLRTAVLEVGPLDASTEPIPLIARSAEVAVVNWAVYLGGLLHRASVVDELDVDLVLEHTIRRLAA
ncbi:MAG: hypothetical protein WBG41_02225 [Acidimicrobiales bacterium]